MRNRVPVQWRASALGWVLLAGSLAAPTAWALEEIGPMLETPAREIEKELRSIQAVEVSVGSFKGSAIGGSTQGSGVATLWEEAFQQLGVKVNPLAKFELSGEYRPRHRDGDPRQPVIAARINWTLSSLEGETVARGTVEIDGSRLERERLVKVLKELFPDLEIEGDDSTSQVISVGGVEPGTEVDELVVTDANQQPVYGLQVLNQDTESLPALALRQEGELAMVDVRGLRSIAVRVRNYTREEAAVQLTMDGVPVFALSEPPCNYQYYFVPAGGELIIRGWHITNQRADRFILVTYGESAAAQALSRKSTSDLGTIQATFIPCSREPRKSGGSEPVDERKIGRGEWVTHSFRSSSRYLVPKEFKLLSVRYSRAEASTSEGNSPLASETRTSEAPATIDEPPSSDTPAVPVDSAAAPGSPPAATPETSPAGDSNPLFDTPTTSLPAGGGAPARDATRPKATVAAGPSAPLLSGESHKGPAATAGPAASPAPVPTVPTRSPAALATHAGQLSGRVLRVKGDIVTIEVATSIAPIEVALRYRLGYTRNAALLEPGKDLHVLLDQSSKLVAEVKLGDQNEAPIARGKAPVVPVSRRRLWVLLIGVESYRKLDRLDLATEDVNLLYNLYVEHGGVDPSQILRVCDDAALQPDLATLQRVIPDFLRTIPAGDTVVVYFSGHGQRARISGTDEDVVYLAPSDCDPARLAESAIPADQLLGQLAGCKARGKVLMLDACYSGAINGGQILKVLGKDNGVACLISCQKNQTSRQIGALGQSVFTYWLGQALSGQADSDHNRRIDFNELFTCIQALSRPGTQSVQNPAQFYPPNVREAPVVFELGGAAAALSEARGLAHTDPAGALEMLLALEGPEEPGLALERLELQDELYPRAKQLYLKKARSELAPMEAEGAVLSDWDRKCLVPIHLALASIELEDGNRGGFLGELARAQALAAAIGSPLDRVRAGVAVAEARYMESRRLESADARTQMNDEVRGLLKGLADQVGRQATAPLQAEMLLPVAATAWRVHWDEAWQEHLDRLKTLAPQVYPYAPTLEWFKLQGLAFAQARDPLGAMECAVKVNDLGELEEMEVPGSAQKPRACAAFAAAALAAAREGENRVALRAIGQVEALLAKVPAADGERRYWQAISDLARAHATLGQVEDAERVAKSLSDRTLAHYEIKAELVRKHAERGDLERARELYRSVASQPIPDRGEAVRAIAQATTVVDQGRIGQLLEWIGKDLKTPAERASAYVGVADGLNRKPWILAAIHGPGRPDLLLAEAGVRSTPWSYQVAPVARPAAPVTSYGPTTPPTGTSSSQHVARPNLIPIDQRAQTVAGRSLTAAATGMAVYNAVESFSNGNWQGGVSNLIGAGALGGGGLSNYSRGYTAPSIPGVPTSVSPRSYIPSFPGRGFLPF